MSGLTLSVILILLWTYLQRRKQPGIILKAEPGIILFVVLTVICIPFLAKNKNTSSSTSISRKSKKESNTFKKAKKTPLKVMEDESVLSGAGASFPNPLYQKWFETYGEEGLGQVFYSAVGSGKGVKRILEKSTDFSGTDAYITDEKLATVNEEILHIPTCLGGVVVSYNLPDSPELRFSPKTLSDIFLGKITKWNDPIIKDENPDEVLPDLPIKFVYRSDKSGTTFIFTNYLSRVSSELKSSVGAGKKVSWPVGESVEGGNSGVAQYLTDNEGAISYVSYSFAQTWDLPTASIQNQSGIYVEPTLESISEAANVSLPDDTRAIISDTIAFDGYPIASFTWIVFYKEQNYDGRSKVKSKSLADLLWWMIHDGQKYNAQKLYAPLPQTAVEKAEAIIKKLTYNGKNLIK